VELTRHRTSVDAADPAAVEVHLRPDGHGFSWNVANTGRADVVVRSVTAVYTLGGLAGRLRMYCSGRQSRSEAATFTHGVDVDPATTGSSTLEVRSHHCDPEGARPDRLRSEMVTVVLDDRGAALAGFLGGDLHDGVLAVGPGQTGQELRVQAFLGGVVLRAGEERELHDVWVHPTDDPLEALGLWAGECGRRSLARTRTPQQVGWCSWHHYGTDLGELEVRQNLAAVGDWPLELFRVDDGYQSAVGDWLSTNDRFPSGLASLSAAVASAGCRPGLWLAPFLAAPGSVLAAEHPHWIARALDGGPLTASYDRRWGGFVHALDTTHPEVQDHLRSLGASLVELGFDDLTLAHTGAPGLAGRFHDPSSTPAQRVRAGLDALREGAGESAVLVGSGAPLGPSVGVVDAMRVGPDVASWWSPHRELWGSPAYLGTVPAVRNAWRNTMTRSFLHRRFWLNDPDCVLLRPPEDSELSAEQVRAWALLVAASGGSVMVSDELGLLDDRARDLLGEVLGISRRVDQAATRGDAPQCDDLFDHVVPGRLRGDGVRFEGDPDRGAARAVTF
jgi:alpha-galactosidase